MREYKKQQEIELERKRQLELDHEIELKKQRELERQKEVERQKEQERQKDNERQKQLEEIERWAAQSDRLKAQEREKQKVREDLKKIEELERIKLIDFELQKEKEKKKRTTKKQPEQVGEGQRETEQGTSTAESPLRPKVLDLDNVCLGDRSGPSLSSDQSPTPRWKQPSSALDEVYKPSILDVDSFRNQTQPGVSVDPFGMTTFASLDLDRNKPMTPISGAKMVSPIHPQSLLQNLQRDTTPPQAQMQAPFQFPRTEEARLPPPLQPQVLNQSGLPTERPKPQIQSHSVTPDWSHGEHQFDLWGSSQGEVAVDEPSWLSSTESSKRPNSARQSSLEQILQRHEERYAGTILNPNLAPVQSPGITAPLVPVQMPTLRLPTSPGHVLSPEKIFNTDDLFAGSRRDNQTALSSLIPESVWSWSPASQEPSQTQPSSTGSQEQSRLRSRSVHQRPAPAETSVDGPLARIRSRSAQRDKRQESKVKQGVSGQGECKDTDTLVQETDSQYGTWDTALPTDDSLTPVTPSTDSNIIPSPRKPSLPHTPNHLSTEEQLGPLNFPQSPTTLLDSSAQRSKVLLSKSCRRRRAPPSRAARHSSVFSDGVEIETEEWRFKDSTEDKPDSAKFQDDESDEEEPPRAGDTRTSSSQPQRVSLFPGMDPSALMAQLKKRGETDSQTDGPSPSQLSRSPKSPFLGRASRVLPPVGGKENGEESSPQWLKELKTKKRLSHIENDC
ncbi:protein PRRC2C isoform X2 [Silurus meridionalis]|uniref:protein PRRC2C isoform X2 n=1 Tax=Silurus meridionalis TaxID=175797 RepID=UPI001EEC8FBF|nr:protein PRRC2C isoform X2 [Silurus meridionalis]